MLLFWISLWAASWAAPAGVWAERLGRAEECLSVPRVMAAGLDLEDARNALGDSGLVFNAAHRDYLWRPESPLVLVYNRDGTLRGPASVGYHLRAAARPRTRARLQGPWRARGVSVSGLSLGRPRVNALPYHCVAIDGRGISFLSEKCPVPATVLFAVSRGAWGDWLVPAYPEPADRAEYERHPFLWSADRLVVWCGPAIITATRGPDWVELSLWHRFP